MKGIITPNSLKSDLKMKIIYRNYLLFLSSQSRRFEIIKPVFVGFSVSSSNCMVNFSAMKLTKKFIAPL